MEKTTLDEQQRLLQAMESSESKPEAEFIEMTEIPKTKDEFRREGYKMEREKMGLCYIINNVDRDQPATRRDVRRCEEVFTNLGLDVKLYLNQTKDEMRALRNNEILNNENYKNCNCLVVLIIAHGTNKRNILDVEQRTAWNLDVLEEQIARLKNLEGRPKLLFVEACRGSQQQKVSVVPKLKNVTEEESNISEKYIEEEDEDLAKLRETGWKGPEELSTKNVGMDNESMDIDEKTKKRGASFSTMTTQISKVSDDLQTMPSKRDQFIGMSTVENYVAFTINTFGSPYLQHLMRELSEGCFLAPLQAIHQTTRQKVGSDPIHENRYMVPDEHNRLHEGLFFKNYLLDRKSESQPLKKGGVSHESSVTLIGVTYNMFDFSPDAHQIFISGYKNYSRWDKTMSHLEVLGNDRFGNQEQPKRYYDLPKDSVVQNVDEPARAFMEIFKTPSECFINATNNLVTIKNDDPLDATKMYDRLVSTKPCPGFNVVEEGKKKHTITFHKEFPIDKISLSQQNQEMLCGKNTSGNNFECPPVFKTWIDRCPTFVSIEDIHKDSSTNQDERTKQKVDNFHSYWESYFGKFGTVQELKKVIAKFPSIKEAGDMFSDGNSAQNTKYPSIKFLIDCGDFFINFECPKVPQERNVPNFKPVKLEELSKEDGEEKRQTYKNLLNYWGHHFVTEFYQGGSITLKLLLTTEDLENAAQIKEYLNNICSDQDMEDKEPLINSTAVIDVQFKGGCIQHHRKAFTEINFQQMKVWKESLQDTPTPLMSKMSILPVHLAVACLDPARAEIVRQESEELQTKGKNWTTLELPWDEGTAEYAGESTKDGKPHGRGTLKSSFEKYSGDFDTGKRSGHGKCHFTQTPRHYAENLCYYSGEWMDDKPQGNGEGHFEKGDIYIGQWKNGKPEGLGTVYYEDGKEAIVLCKEGGTVDELLKGEAQDKKVGTVDPPPHVAIEMPVSKFKKTITLSYNKFNMLEDWKRVSIISAISILSILILGVICYGVNEALREPTCMEVLVDEWEGVNKYDYKQSGFLDVSLSRLNKPETCQGGHLFMDSFLVTSQDEQQRIARQCNSLEVPNITDEFRAFPNGSDNLSVIRRLYGQNIMRFRICDTKSHNCSDISNNKDIWCTQMEKYKNTSCIESMADQWDDITFHNSSSNTLTVDMTKRSLSTKKLCQQETGSVALEIFAVSPNADESVTAYHSCGSFPNKQVVPFVQKMTLNETDLTTIKYISGSFVFRLSHGKPQSCTYPKRTYNSEREDDLLAIWESKTCSEKPKVKPKATPELVDDACSLTVSSFPFFDCYLMDELLTATVKLKLTNETYNTCKGAPDFEQQTGNIMRSTMDNKTPLLQDVTFNLPSNATFCLEVFLNYPLCPSLNVDDAGKCSRPVGGPLQLINCQKTW